MVFTVGLTGGIGSGKSTISDLFAEMGVDVIDTDEIARAITDKGQPAIKRIVAQFGDGIVLPDGALDRDRLREIVFADSGAREKLQNILHPLIRSEVRRRLALTRGPYALVVVPLLVESKGYQFADRILVVDCREQSQIERVMQRSGLTRDQVQSIMATQASRSERLAAADDVIVNEGEISELRSEVEQLHRKYLNLSR